jgi:hypothetical protein
VRPFVLIALITTACGGAGQSRDCRKWLSCYAALPGPKDAAQERAYGPDGECWKSTPQVAKNCSSACTEATVAQGLMQGAPRECM